MDGTRRLLRSCGLAALGLALGLGAAVGTGQADRAQAVTLGAAVTSVAGRDSGLGRRYPESLERNHHLQDLSGAATRQGVRPLRHGARRHCRLRLRQSRLSARTLPDYFGGRAAVSGRPRQGRQSRDRCLVSQIRRKRDEGRALLLLFRARSGGVAFQHQEDRRAGRYQRHEDQAGPRHHRGLGHVARRHQRAVERAGGPRHTRQGRCRCDHLPLGFDGPVRHRQSDQVRHG